MPDLIKSALEAGNVAYSELSNGDIFFRRSDGDGMYVRAHGDGTYDWCVNVARNDTNLMDFRAAERHTVEETLHRIDDFVGLAVSGRVVIDTLGLVQQSMERGMTRETAERVAEHARDLILEMHASGMDAHEIKTRFTEIQEQLRRERLRPLGNDPIQAGL